MDEKELIENLESKLFKLKNDLIIKSENEKHLVYENQSLFEENEKLIEESAKSKELIDKLNIKIKNIEGHVDEAAILRSQNDYFCIEIESLKNELNKKLKEVKNLNKLPNYSYDHENIDDTEKELSKKEIKHLNELNSELSIKIDYQTKEICKLKTDISKEIEIWASKVENYKELLGTAKQERDDIENEYLMFQTDVNQPDYKRQGNSLYVEVNDRRILVEMKLMEFKDELINLRKTNKNLIKFLEDVFEEFSLIKEEEMLTIRQNFRREIEELTIENKSLKSKYLKVHNFCMNEMENISKLYSPESIALKGATIINSMLKIDNDNLKESERKLNIRESEHRERNVRLFNINNRLYKENAALMSKHAEFESKLACWDRIVPENLKKEFETKILAMEEDSKKEVDENPMSSIPAGILGLRFVNATRNDHLVFDYEGRPFENRLTRRVIYKDGREPFKPVKEVIPEPEYTHLNYVKKEDAEKQYLMTKDTVVQQNENIKENISEQSDFNKENITEPYLNEKIKELNENLKETIEPTEWVSASEQVPECNSS